MTETSVRPVKAKKGSNFERISAEWDLQQEALAFIRQFATGRMTQDQIRKAVVMDEKQYDWLVRQYPRERVVIGRIKDHRRMTWKAICYGLAWNDGAKG